MSASTRFGQSDVMKQAMAVRNLEDREKPWAGQRSDSMRPETVESSRPQPHRGTTNKKRIL